MPRFDEEESFRETYGDAPGWGQWEKEAPQGFGRPGRSAMRQHAQRRNPTQRPVGETPIQIQ